MMETGYRECGECKYRRNDDDDDGADPQARSCLTRRREEPELHGLPAPAAPAPPTPRRPEIRARVGVRAVPAAAEALGLALVLTGDVREAGEAVHVDIHQGRG